MVSGEDAVRASLANWIDQFESLRVETLSSARRATGCSTRCASSRAARGSEVEIEGELYMVWWFRDGKAVRMEMYNTSEQAEAAFARTAQPDS